MSKNQIYSYLIFCIAFLSVVILRGQPQVPNRPSPPRLVNDFAGLLSPGDVNQLESTLVSYDDSSSTQIAIVTLKSLGDYAIEDWALEIGRKWGVGSKAKNNGVVIIVSLEPRRINISPGYGLEGALPDVLCKRIISNEITPSMKSGQYAEGLAKGIKAIRGAIKGEYANENRSKDNGGDGEFWIFLIVMGVILIFIIIAANSRRSGGTYYGPHRRRHYENNSGGGGWIIFGNGGGSDWGGGSDSGGGFGGFGGGDFGGGGASGDW